MNEPMQDKNVILIILFTIILVFVLIFSSVSNKVNNKDSLQWRESNTSNLQSINT